MGKRDLPCWLLEFGCDKSAQEEQKEGRGKNKSKLAPPPPLLILGATSPTAFDVLSVLPNQLFLSRRTPHQKKGRARLDIQ